MSVTLAYDPGHLGLRFANQNFSITIGRFPDGSPAEVFIDLAKSGQDLQSIVRDAGVALPLALQHGVPIATIRRAITRDGNGAPASILGAVVDRLPATPRGAA